MDIKEVDKIGRLDTNIPIIRTCHRGGLRAAMRILGNSDDTKAKSPIGRFIFDVGNKFHE